MLVTNLNEGNSSFNTLKEKSKKEREKIFPAIGEATLLRYPFFFRTTLYQLDQSNVRIW